MRLFILCYSTDHHAQRFESSTVGLQECNKQQEYEDANEREEHEDANGQQEYVDGNGQEEYEDANGRQEYEPLLPDAVCNSLFLNCCKLLSTF